MLKMAQQMIDTMNKSKSKEENTMNAYDCEHHSLWCAVSDAYCAMCEAAKNLYFKKKIHDTLGYDTNNIVETAKADLECAMAKYEKAYTTCYEHECRHYENYRTTREWEIYTRYTGNAEIELYELKIEG